MTATYDLTTDVGQVRLLLNDIPTTAEGATEPTAVFTDAEVTAFLALEAGSVKRAAAQAIDTNATNEALASKVLRTDSGVTTDGAKLADAMRKHAAELRRQADAFDDDGDAGYFFDVIDPLPGYCAPERTQRGYLY
ncbi:hypothetical protein [Nocardioides bruguierae]|uniref:hypothetical protein n=1 Tax=Nocardioides bruguierae TaxID=2945102 RepID=UPI0020206EB0|nr:hypothetical protein [Nocardioides bruguierae]MCL8026316.1 hypothetical protein [Nocardioides bruguierae]